MGLIKLRQRVSLKNPAMNVCIWEEAHDSPQRMEGSALKKLERFPWIHAEGRPTAEMETMGPLQRDRRHAPVIFICNQ